MSENKEYIEREALIDELDKRPERYYFTVINEAPAADVEPVGNRTTFDEEAALEIGNFIDLCEVDAEAMDGFVQDRFKTYLHALVYESVPAHMERSGSGEYNRT